MRRLKLVGMLGAFLVAVLAMSAPPAAAQIDDFGFGDLGALNNDFCDEFNLDSVCDDEEGDEGDTDIDEFSVGEWECFAVTEEDNGEEDLEDVFCVPPTGGAPVEVL